VKKIIWFSFLSSVLISELALSNGVASYVESEISFSEIKNKYQESRAWATCSVTFLFYSQYMAKEKPARSKQLQQVSNGAKLASRISLFLRSVGDSPSVEKFSATWNASGVASESDFEIATTALLAELESSKTFGDSLALTLEACGKNLSQQEAYVESWRELSASGLFEAEK